MRRDLATFCSTWNSSSTLADAATSLGGTKHTVSAYASYLRTHGTLLRYFGATPLSLSLPKPPLSLPQLFYAAKGKAAESPDPCESA